MPLEMIQLGFLGSLVLFCGGAIGILFIWPPRLVELSPDPPESAHQSQFTTEELKQVTIDIQLFWLAWTHLDGRLAERPLWAVVENWNRQYERYPEYTNWIISRDVMREIIGRYYSGIVPIPLKIKGKVEWFVVVPNGRSKLLQPLAGLLNISPEPEEVMSEMRDEVDELRGEVLDVADVARELTAEGEGLPYLNGSTSG